MPLTDVFYLGKQISQYNIDGKDIISHKLNFLGVKSVVSDACCGLPVYSFRLNPESNNFSVSSQCVDPSAFFKIQLRIIPNNQNKPINSIEKANFIKRIDLDFPPDSSAIIYNQKYLINGQFILKLWLFDDIYQDNCSSFYPLYSYSFMNDEARLLEESLIEIPAFYKLDVYSDIQKNKTITKINSIEFVKKFSFIPVNSDNNK